MVDTHLSLHEFKTMIRHKNIQSAGGPNKLKNQIIELF
jgi:hypothetical protein